MTEEEKARKELEEKERKRKEEEAEKARKKKEAEEKERKQLEEARKKQQVVDKWVEKYRSKSFIKLYTRNFNCERLKKWENE
jgi:hypothetical protein